MLYNIFEEGLNKFGTMYRFRSTDNS